jgi:hypothetical protein
MKDAMGKIVAKTKATFQKPDEINCAKCHGHGTSFARLDTEARMHTIGKIRVVTLPEYLIDFSKI